jgi:serine protease
MLSTLCAATSGAWGQARLRRLPARIPEIAAADALNRLRPLPIQQVLVKFKPVAAVAPAEFARQFSQKFAAKAATRAGAVANAPALTYRRSNSALGWHVYRLPAPAALGETLDALRRDPNVLKAEPDYPVRMLLSDPNDYYWNRVDQEHTILQLNSPYGLGYSYQDAQDLDSSSWTYLWPLEPNINGSIDAEGGWEVYPGHYHTAAERKSLLASDPARLPLVAIVDSGIDFTHPDFSYTGNPGHGMADTDVAQGGGQIAFSLARSFVNGNTDPNPLLAKDDVGHGTSVAGVIAAAPNDAIGVIGVGFPARIVPVKVLDNTGTGTDSDLLDGITYAVDQHCLLINASLAVDTTTFSQALQDAVDYAWNHGTLLVAAAGNDGHNDPNSSDGQYNPQAGLLRRYPANCTGVLAVSATTFGGGDVADGARLASYSNYGDCLGLAAPGGDITHFNNYSPDGADLFPIIDEYVFIWTTAPTYTVALSDPNDPNGVYGAAGLYGLGYGGLPGTSLATPHVVGLAALYAAKNGVTQAPGVPQQLVRALELGAQQGNTRTDGGSDPFFGYGLIDCYGTMADLNPRSATVGGCIGQLTVSGTPVANITVTAQKSGSTKKYTAATYPDGMYHLSNLPAGTYTLTASALGNNGSAAVAIVAGSDTLNANLPLGAVVVTIAPRYITLNFGATQQFSATVTGTSSTDVVWSLPVDAGATISPAGLLTAPAHPGASLQAVVKATSLADTSKSDTTTVTFASKITGTVTLNGAVNEAQTLTFEFRPTGGGANVTRTVTLGATGAFTLTDIPPGSYNLAIKGRKWLRRVVAVNASNGNVSGVMATLLPGDVTGNNVVDIADLGELADAFNATPASPNWNANADLNCDGKVNILDLGLLAENYGRSGDP